MPKFAVILSVFTLLLVSGTGAALDVPLRYMTREKTGATGRHVASVSLANHDMLTPGAKAASFHMDFESSKSQGLMLLNENDTTPTTAAGRKCRYSQSALRLRVDDPTSGTSKGTLYVLVEYLDAGPTTTSLQIIYDGQEKGDTKVANMFTDPVPFANSGQWKKQQFRLDDALLGTGSNNAADFLVSVIDAGRYYAGGYHQVNFMERLPGSGWQLPEPVGEKPLYGLLMLGDGVHLVALDRQSSSSRFYDRLRADANGNRSLLDDPVLTSTVSTDSYSTRTSFADIAFTVQVDGKPFPYLVSYLSVQQNRQTSLYDRPVSGNINCGCWYEGDIEVDGNNYRFCLGDSNANGRFDDTVDRNSISESQMWSDGALVSQIYVKGDSLTVIPGGVFLGQDSGKLGNMLGLGGKMFDLRVDMPNNRMVLTPTAKELYAVKLPEGTTEVELTALNGACSAIAVHPPGGECRVPRGLYTIRRYVLEKKDESGTLWRASATGLPIASSFLFVGPDEQARAVYGEPFRGILKASNPFAKPEPGMMAMSSPRGRGTASQLSLSVRGAADESVTQFERIVGSSVIRAKNPRWMVAKPDGEAIARGRFEYG